MINQVVRQIIRALGFDLHHFNPSSDSSHEIYQLLRSVIRPVIFDVGAHHGETASVFSNLFPSADLYCFEPFEESFVELRKNSSNYPTATLEQIGLSDSSGMHEFHSNANSATNSLLQLEDRAANIWANNSLVAIKKVDCNFLTLDKYIEDKNIKQIDLLKMDVQGAELRVLKGAKEAFKTNRIRNVYMEIIIGDTYSRQEKFSDYLNVLDSLGFRVHGLFNLFHGVDRRLLVLDALFTRK